MSWANHGCCFWLCGPFVLVRLRTAERLPHPRALLQARPAPRSPSSSSTPCASQVPPAAANRVGSSMCQAGTGCRPCIPVLSSHLACPVGPAEVPCKPGVVPGRDVIGAAELPFFQRTPKVVPGEPCCPSALARCSSCSGQHEGRVAPPCLPAARPRSLGSFPCPLALLPPGGNDTSVGSAWSAFLTGQTSTSWNVPPPPAAPLFVAVVNETFFDLACQDGVPSAGFRSEWWWPGSSACWRLPHVSAWCQLMRNAQ